MFPDIFLPLVKYFSGFNIFQYITFRSAYAAITALIFSFVFGRPIIRKLQRLKAGQEVRDDGPETHYVKSGTPTMGGLLILVSVTIATLLWQDLKNSYTWLLLFAMIAFGGIGFVDDYLKIFRRSSDGMHARVKFIGQTLVALIIVLFLYTNGNEHTTLLYIPFFKYAIVDLSYLYIPFGVILLVGTSNAVNLTDGLDGLAIGLVILVGITFAILTYITGRMDYSEYLQIPYLPGTGELTVMTLAIVGASIGFLWYNSHPAEVFMGDTGSLSLGGVIGVLALVLKKEILLVVIGGVFVLEVLSVIIQVVSYKWRKKRVFKMAPLHHHFEMKGWDESKVVIRFWILGMLFTILSLSTLKIQ